jgi:hypothetical protein
MANEKTVQCGVCKKYYEDNVDLFAILNFDYPICNLCYKD